METILKDETKVLVKPGRGGQLLCAGSSKKVSSGVVVRTAAPWCLWRLITKQRFIMLGVGMGNDG